MFTVRPSHPPFLAASHLPPSALGPPMSVRPYFICAASGLATVRLACPPSLAPSHLPPLVPGPTHIAVSSCGCRNRARCPRSPRYAPRALPFILLLTSSSSARTAPRCRPRALRHRPRGRAPFARHQRSLRYAPLALPFSHLLTYTLQCSDCLTAPDCRADAPTTRRVGVRLGTPMLSSLYPFFSLTLSNAQPAPRRRLHAGHPRRACLTLWPRAVHSLSTALKPCV